MFFYTPCVHISHKDKQYENEIRVNNKGRTCDVIRVNNKSE